ncbi:hypothetical protein T07_2518 [Trichinella nelsoni]|uniref:Uncharacterized protein n=1 Tax=Trichinella nelsoni TaxID=6336 RepID=A0A0V0RMI5_9BILA|nr:hypothetical protein T07_2518 [Trichinella nelsoni]
MCMRGHGILGDSHLCTGKEENKEKLAKYKWKILAGNGLSSEFYLGTVGERYKLIFALFLHC